MKYSYKISYSQFTHAIIKPVNIRLMKLSSFLLKFLRMIQLHGYSLQQTIKLAEISLKKSSNVKMFEVKIFYML